MESITSDVLKPWGWGTFYFSKCSKSNVDSKNAIKNYKKSLVFSDNCIWIGSSEFSLLLQEYL